jgi:hypothetical protein
LSGFSRNYIVLYYAHYNVSAMVYGVTLIDYTVVMSFAKVLWIQGSFEKFLLDFMSSESVGTFQLLHALKDLLYNC